MKAVGINPSHLAHLSIANTTITSIDLCSVEDAVGPRDDPVIACEALDGLKTLDVRHNMLTTMSEFNLTNLQELYLAGNLQDPFFLPEYF